jgi:gliding motility-associated-like protein
MKISVFKTAILGTLLILSRNTYACNVTPSLNLSNNHTCGLPGVIQYQNSSTGSTVSQSKFWWKINSILQNDTILGRDSGVFILSKPGVNVIKLFVKDSAGCIDSVSSNITVTTSAKTIKDMNFNYTHNPVWMNCLQFITDPDTFNVAVESNDTLKKLKIFWGDGSMDTTGADVNPNTPKTHMFMSLGIFTVKIVTQNGACTDTVYGKVFNQRQPTAGVIGPTSGSNRGCVPHVMKIVNNSYNISDNTNFFVEWGNGDSETLPYTAYNDTLTHLYTKGVCSGIIKITATNVCGSSFTTWNPIDISEKDKARWTVTSTCDPVQDHIFYNVSVDKYCLMPDVKEYFWDFGDGTTVGWTTSKAPQYHKFATEGDFMVRLIVKTACGNDTFEDVVRVYYKPTAQFIFDVNDDCQPVNGIFTDTSKGREYTRLWTITELNNIYTSTDSVVNYQFTQGGVHTVKLKVSNQCGVDSLVQTVSVKDKPSASFASITSTCVPVTVNFNNTSTSYFTQVNYEWDFGDGTSSTLKNPASKVYATEGAYTIRLVVKDSCGNDTFYRSFNAYGLPQAFLNGDTTACTFDSLVLRNHSINSNTFNFDFGDNSTLTTNDTGVVKHLYTSFGNFTIRIIAGTGAGCLDTAYHTVYIKPGAKADFGINQNFACAPAIFKFNNQSIYGQNYSWFANGHQVSNSNTLSDTLINSDSTIIRIKLIATSNSSCQSDSIEKVIFTAKNPTAVIANPGAGCGPFAVQFNNQSSNYSNSFWDLGNGSTSTNNNPSSTYAHAVTKDTTYLVQLRVRNWLGCSDSTTNTLNVYPAPKADFDALTYEGCGPFAAQFTNMSSTNNSDLFSTLTHQWDFNDGQTSNNSDPSHTFNPSTIKDTIYKVKLKVVSINGCVDSINKNIRVFPIPSVKFTPDKVSGCALLPVAFNNQSSPKDTGKINIMSFQWTSGNGAIANTQNFNSTYNASILGDTVYQVKLIGTSEHGCKDSMTFNVTVHPNPIASFEPNQKEACTPFKVSSINQSVSKDGGPLSHSWDFGNTFKSSNENDSSLYINNSNSDMIFTINYIAISQYNCRDTANRNVVVHPKPIAKMSVSSKKLCAPANVVLFDQSTNAFDYYWGEGSYNVFGPNNSQTMNFQGLNLFDSLYIVKHAVTSQYGCLSDTVYEQILVMGRPEANFELSKDSTCAKEKINMINTSLGGYRYNWNFGDNTANSNLVNPKHNFPINNSSFEDTAYTVTLIVSSTANCKDTASKVAYLVAPPKEKIVLDKPLGCTDLTVTFTHQSTRFSTLFWDFGDNSPIDIFDTVVHTYVNPFGDLTMQPKVALHRERFNCLDTTYTSLMVYPKPVADFRTQRNDPCDAGKYQFINKSKNNNSNQWLFDDGTIVNVSSFSTILPASEFKDTFYNVKLYVKNAYQCVDSNDQIIKVKPKLKISFEKDAEMACEKGVVQFTNKSSNAERYFWKFGDGGLSNEVNPKYVYNQFGTYKITLYGYDKDGCVDSSKSAGVFKVLEKPKADFSYLPALPKLPNAQVDFVAKPTIMTANVNDLYYEWNFGDGSYPTSNFNQKNPSHIYTSAGTVEVTLLVRNNICDDVAKKFIFIEDPKPEVAFTADTAVGCAALKVKFTNTTQHAHTYRWVWGDGTPDSYEKEPVHVFNYSGNWDVTLIATGTGGTSTLRIPVMITVHPKPIADFVVHKQTLNLPNAVFSMQNNSLNAFKYNWTLFDTFNNAIETSTLRDPSFLINEEGRYSVRLVSINSFGCTDTMYKPKYLATIKEGYVYVPSAFSPNNNTKNDDFKPSLYNVRDEQYVFRIYNRWGEKVFETTDVNEAWDGTLNGNPCEQDVYVWTVSGMFINYDTFSLRGTLTLLK